jgi:hypothetical protein
MNLPTIAAIVAGTYFVLWAGYFAYKWLWKGMYEYRDHHIQPTLLDPPVRSSEIELENSYLVNPDWRYPNTSSYLLTGAYVPGELRWRSELDTSQMLAHQEIERPDRGFFGICTPEQQEVEAETIKLDAKRKIDLGDK